jgi:hypothetical protein
MLDYAANAVVYWPVETIRAKFEQECGGRSDDPATVLGAFLGPGADHEEFWQRVKTNLQAGKIRMVFVADVIPPELRRVVEFLNGQMDPAEVLAVEIRQFVGQGLTTLVPRVMGQTVEAERNKGKASVKQWDESGFFADLRQRRGDEEADAARVILEWAKAGRLRVWWGKGNKDGSFYPMLDFKGEPHWVVSVWTSGRAEIPFQWMLNKKPFGDEVKRRELLARLTGIGLEIPADALARRPTVPLTAFIDRQKLDQFLAVLNWYLDEVRAA